MSKKRLSNQIVVIHVDALRREYLSSWYLGERLKKKGFHVFLTSRHSTSRLLRFLTPDAFISTHVFQLQPNQWEKLVSNGGNAYINEVEGTNHQSGVASTYPAVSHQNDFFNYNLFSRIYVWNQYTRKWLHKKRNIAIDNIMAVGSIRLSKSLQTNTANHIKSIGILSRFEVINTFDKRHFFENLISIDPESKDTKWYFERCAIDSQTFSITCKFINLVTSKGYKVIVRPHPNENLDAYSFLQQKFGSFVEIDTSYTIEEWLLKVSKVFGPTSSAFTDAYIRGVPIISMSNIQTFKYTGVAHRSVMEMFDQAAYKPDTVEKAADLCAKKELLPKKTEALDRYFNKFYNLKLSHDPIVKIVNDITNLQSTNQRFRNPLRILATKTFILVFDFLAILKNLLSLNPAQRMRAHQIYNLNHLLHRPSAYMRSLI